MNGVDPSGESLLIESTMITAIISIIYTSYLTGMQVSFSQRMGVRWGDVWAELGKLDTWLEALLMTVISLGISILLSKVIAAMSLVATFAAVLPIVMATFMTASMIGHLASGEKMDRQALAHTYAVMIAGLLIGVAIGLTIAGAMRYMRTRTPHKKVVNVGGPLDDAVSARSTRGDYLDVNLTPTGNPNTIVADVNTTDLSALAGKDVRLLRASNVPFVEVPSGAYVQPDVFASQASSLGAQRVVVSTGPDSVGPLVRALQALGYGTNVRSMGGRTIVSGALL